MPPSDTFKQWRTIDGQVILKRVDNGWIVTFVRIDKRVRKNKFKRVMKVYFNILNLFYHVSFSSKLITY